MICLVKLLFRIVYCKSPVKNNRPAIAAAIIRNAKYYYLEIKNTGAAQQVNDE